MTILIRPLDRLSHKYPLLFYGVAAFIGVLITRTGNGYFLLFLIPLLIHRISPLFITLIFALYTYITPHHSSGSGPFTFHIDSISYKTSPYNTVYRYNGTIKGHGRITYTSPQKVLKNPTYFVEKGTLRNGFLRARTLTPLSAKKSLAYKRFELKEKAASFIKKHYPVKEHADLITALTTGLRKNHLLSYQFSRLGLAHILAISGFHFGLIAYLLFRLLSPFMRMTTANTFVLIILSLYFIFLGPSPSISRAFVASLIILFAPFVGRAPLSIDALGCALLICLAFDPHAAVGAGFQLSFAATLGILTLTPRTLRAINRFWPPPEASELRFSPFAFLLKLGKPIRALIALNLSVHLVTLPIILTHFQIFPLASLVYNLFFPFLITLSMSLFLLGLHPLNIPLLHLMHTLLSYPPTQFLFNLSFTLPILLTPFLLMYGLRASEDRFLLTN